LSHHQPWHRCHLACRVRSFGWWRRKALPFPLCCFGNVK
jgi:hypothetical protein